MNQPHLPDRYCLIEEIDLKKDAKLALVLNLASLLIAVVIIVPAALLKPFSLVFSPEQSFFEAIAPLLAMFLLMVFYIFAHELTHGFFFKRYSHKKAVYGFHFLFASAGSPDYYYDKKSYLVIGLAPVVLLGALLCIPLFFLQGLWFWSVFMIQVLNVSGAAGDLYVTYRMQKMPDDLLVNDDGMRMRFYSGMQQAQE